MAEKALLEFLEGRFCRDMAVLLSVLAEGREESLATGRT
jgi:hypothetical protein